ncbi:MAG TPA: hypothetical protein VGF23_13820 [Gaiellaceae bacterium]
MKRMHVAAVAVILAVASVFGVVAAAHTAGLGAAARASTPAAAIAGRQQRLDRIEASLRKALADRPPALPAVPSAPTAAAPAPRVVYHRPAPIVVVTHRAGGEHEGYEAEHSEGEGRDD